MNKDYRVMLREKSVELNKKYLPRRGDKKYHVVHRGVLKVPQRIIDIVEKRNGTTSFELKKDGIVWRVQARLHTTAKPISNLWFGMCIGSNMGSQVRCWESMTDTSQDIVDIETWLRDVNASLKVIHTHLTLED